MQDIVDSTDRRGASITCPQTHVGSHLIISASGGMKSTSRGTDRFGERRFDVHMNIFFGGIPNKGRIFDVGGDRPQPFSDALGIFLGHDPLRRQHVHMRDRALDVVFRKAFVHIDARTEARSHRVWLLIKSTSPSFGAHGS